MGLTTISPLICRLDATLADLVKCLRDSGGCAELAAGADHLQMLAAVWNRVSVKGLISVRMRRFCWRFVSFVAIAAQVLASVSRASD